MYTIHRTVIHHANRTYVVYLNAYKAVDKPLELAVLKAVEVDGFKLSSVEFPSDPPEPKVG